LARHSLGRESPPELNIEEEVAGHALDILERSVTGR
jgi:hypothetical protein